MLTTTIDGLWVLQVLAGIEVLAPELGLRPILPSLETAQLALDHPMAAELQDAGVIDEAGAVDPIIIEWLTVLGRRDIGLLFDVRTPETREAPAGAILARFAQWWVVLERSEEIIRIGGAGTASVEGAANAVLAAQIERLCGKKPPGALRPVTLDADALLADVRNQETLRKFLQEQRLEADQQHPRRTECGNHHRHPRGPAGRRARVVCRQEMDGHCSGDRDQHRQRGQRDGAASARQ
jgi:hypothetical protein